MPKYVSALLIILSTAIYQVNAQTWEMGGGVLAAGYIGDFNASNPLKFTDPGAALFLKRNFNNYFSVKLNLAYASISGADSLSSNQQFKDRNLSFNTSLGEISLIAELNFFNYVPQIGKNKFTPFIFAGIGSVKYNPQATYNGQVYDLRPLVTEGQTTPYKERALAIPYGAGVKYNFAGQWNFIVDLGYRTTNTNYLDDVGGVYADKSLLPTTISKVLSDRSGERTGNYIGSAGSQRGNFHSDTYMYLGFSISYTFLSHKCYCFN